MDYENKKKKSTFWLFGKKFEIQDVFSIFKIYLIPNRVASDIGNLGANFTSKGTISKSK